MKITLKKSKQKTLSMNLKRNASGDLIMSDHPDFDIVVYVKKLKVVTFPKEIYNDHIYNIQSQFMKSLAKSFIIDPGTVASSMIYGSLEAELVKSDGEIDPVSLLLLIVDEWLQDEKSKIEHSEELEKEMERFLTDPDEDESTELGEVPHAEYKGNMPRTPIGDYGHGYYYLYENEEK